MDLEPKIKLGHLYPEFSPNQLTEAESRIWRYLTLLDRIARRLQTEGNSVSAPDLTHLATEANICHERSNVPTKPTNKSI